MRTTLILKEPLVKELMGLEGWKSKTQAFETAIEDYVRRRRRQRLSAARGRLVVADHSRQLREMELHER